MMTQKFKLAAIAVVITIVSNLSILAQVSGGGYAESYLFRNVGCRAIGMAGAYTAVANDPSTLFFNPAGLSSLSDRAMILTYVSPIGNGRLQNYASWGQRFDKLGVGISFNNFNTSSFTARDVRGNPLGTLNDVQYSLTAGLAYTMEFASFGASFKYLNNSLNYENTLGSGYGIDLGAKFDIAGLFTFGLAMQNIAGNINWNTTTNDKANIPYTIRAGFGMEFPFNTPTITTRTTSLAELDTIYEPSTRYMLLSFDVGYNQLQEQPNLILGAEIVPHEFFAIRAGTNIVGDNMGKLEFLPFNIWGAGISLRPTIQGLPFAMHFDYSIAYEFASNDRMSHHFSLFLQF